MADFVAPSKKITKMQDVPLWLSSEAYDRYLTFILQLNNAVKRKPLNEPCNSTNRAIDVLLALLDTLDEWMQTFAPLEQPQRFGNKAYRQWHEKLVQESDQLIKEVLKSAATAEEAAIELRPYLNDAFGNPTRIDYGTGHEASFLMFLCCLFTLGTLKESDALAVVLKVFHRYVQLVRNLQRTYKMEPAGSQGVWALDDYHFMPFIWGSAQLIDHPKLLPDSFVKEDLLPEFAPEFMFFECIQYISQVKTALRFCPFAEHSKQLWNISGVPSWTKVNTGLIKMYQAEVLKKFPVVQHFWFGSLLPLRPKDEK